MGMQGGMAWVTWSANIFGVPESLAIWNALATSSESFFSSGDTKLGAALPGRTR
jgi:hypothetical protein